MLLGRSRTLSRVGGVLLLLQAACGPRDAGPASTDPDEHLYFDVTETFPGYGCEYVTLVDSAGRVGRGGDFAQFNCAESEMQSLLGLFTEAKMAAYGAAVVDRDTLPELLPNPDTPPFPAGEVECWGYDAPPTRHWVEVVWRARGSHEYQNFTFAGCAGGEAGELVTFGRMLFDKYYWGGERPGAPPCPDEP